MSIVRKMISNNLGNMNIETVSGKQYTLNYVGNSGYEVFSSDYNMRINTHKYLKDCIDDITKFESTIEKILSAKKVQEVQ